MSFDLLSPEGLRVDGRRPPELRRISCRTGVFAQADGSAYIEHGNTKCLAAVYGPHEPHKRSALQEKVAINVEFNVASFSSGDRKHSGRQDRRLLEIATLIKQNFEPVISLPHSARTEIDIFLQLLQVDGGALHAAVNAATLALVDAGIPMTDYVCACSAGFVNNAPILDLNYIEENAEVPTLTIGTLVKSGKLTLVTSEHKLHMDHFEPILRLACEGSKQIGEVLDETIRKSTKRMALAASTD
ncbi:ribosomal protein S5 domain 2-type protein [Cladochytrium replicatum]|nr:ribosomal protein S5 domain 2-type protein [Cladochytrium replicatum]